MPSMFDKVSQLSRDDIIEIITVSYVDFLDLLTILVIKLFSGGALPAQDVELKSSKVDKPGLVEAARTASDIVGC